MTNPFFRYAVVVSAFAFSVSTAAQTPALTGAAKLADSVAREIN
jgi:hypothetical protein